MYWLPLAGSQNSLNYSDQLYFVGVLSEPASTLRISNERDMNIHPPLGMIGQIIDQSKKPFPTTFMIKKKKTSKKISIEDINAEQRS